jgi:ribosomal protein S18 acetylase RimI-like enzyme
MNIILRPADPDDYAFCKRLYFTENQWILDALGLDRAAHEARFPDQWKVSEVRLIVLNGEEIGWLQIAAQADALFLGQIYIVRSSQRQGIGTEVLRRVIAEAATAQLPLQLDVAKINPALRLYQRLGFQITGEEQHKFNMTLNANAS